MRTPARIVVPVAAAALPLTSCSSTANDTGGDQISLITDGTLTVCTNPPYEPFEFEQDGKVVGLDMDIVNEVAKDLVHDVHVEADDLAVLLELERLVRRVGADREGALGDEGDLLAVSAGGGAAGGEQKGGRGHRDHDPNWGTHGDGPLVTASRMTIRRQR